MKRNGSYLRQYLPWLGLLLGVDALAALLLWLVDARAFAAMTAVIVLATVFLFAGVCAVLCARSKKRERAFTAFLTAPDAAHEQALCRLLSANEAQSVHLLGETLRAQQQAIAQLQAQMDDYENYVELWAHEVKTPLALLTLVLDNRRDTLPEAVGFKLDYVRNRMQAFIDQMLYYARLRGARRDYRFERLTLRGCIDEVLDDYRPLLEEKGFRVEIRPTDETVFADRRGLCFLLGQVVSNSVKYALEKPVLTFSLENGGTATVLSIRDNGPGVRACDLPYVFEKGFTGDSGHEKNKATGMGLYLAREVAKDLGTDGNVGIRHHGKFPVQSAGEFERVKNVMEGDLNFYHGELELFQNLGGAAAGDHGVILIGEIALGNFRALLHISLKDVDLHLGVFCRQVEQKCFHPLVWDDSKKPNPTVHHWAPPASNFTVIVTHGQK